MDNELNGRERRQVHVQTIHGAIEGYVETGERIRTLDDLNMFSRKFLRIEDAVVSSNVWSFDSGTIGVNSSAILFVIERTRFADSHVQVHERIQQQDLLPGNVGHHHAPVPVQGEGRHLGAIAGIDPPDVQKLVEPGPVEIEPLDGPTPTVENQHLEPVDRP